MKKLFKWTLMFVLTFSLLATCFSSSISATSASSRNEAGEYVGRNYDEAYDVILDDITTEDGFLRANYSNTAGITQDDAIFKSCSPANEQGVYDYLVFKMRGTDASLADLQLSFRKADGIPFITLPFEELVDPDLDSFKDLGKELTDSYQLFVINLNDSLDGLYYDEAKTIAGDNKFLGFHLIAEATEGVAGCLDIDEVYFTTNSLTTGYVSNGENALMDTFNRVDVNLAPEGIYWCGSACGKTIYSVQAILKDASYEKDFTANTLSHLVLRLRGEVGNEEVSIKLNDLEAVKLSTLHDTAETTLPALTNGFVNYVIDLKANSLPVDFTKLQVSVASGLVYLDQVFVTNMEVSENAPSYPNLDKDILMYDDFTRAELGAFGEWMQENQVAQAAGFDYLISYAGLDYISIQNGALVFDNSKAGLDYFNYKSNASTRSNDGSYPYLVFKVKVSDGGSLDNFRFQTLENDAPKGGIIWAHSLFSAKNLPIAKLGQEGYEYVTSDGWTYIIVDLKETGMSTKPSGLDLYWGGTGKLFIGSIFYAKDRQPVLNENTIITFDDFERETLVATENQYWINQEGATIEEGALKITATGGYAYFRGAAKPTYQNADALFPYLVLTMKGTDGADLNTLRIEGIPNNATHIWVNSGNIKLADGRSLTTDALSENYKTFVIDLVASGFNPKMEGIGIGYDGEGAVGSLYIDSIKFAEAIPYDYTVKETVITFDDFERETLAATENQYWLDQAGCVIEEGALKIATTGGYAYFRGAAKPTYQNADALFPYLVLTMKGTDGADLNTLRIEGIPNNLNHVWVNSGKIILADGSALTVDALTDKYQDFVIDLVASGFDPKMEGVGLGYDGEGAVGTLYVDAIRFADKLPTIAAVESSAKEVEALKLATPTLTINKDSVDITPVPNALGYVLYQGSNEVATYKPSETLSYSLTSLELGSYPFTVVALGNGVTILNSSVSEVVTYELSVSSIAIKTAGKVNFENNEEFTTGALALEKVLSNGSKVALNANEYTVDSSLYQKDKAGTYKITVKLNNSTLETTYDVTVKAASTTSSSCNLFGAALYQVMIAVSSIGLALFLLRKKK